MQHKPGESWETLCGRAANEYEKGSELTAAAWGIPMSTATVRHKPIMCPHCKTEQRIHLLAVPDKPPVLIPQQTVLCAACKRDFYLLSEAKIVDGPFAV
jgi:hypothetical protein